MCVVRKGWQYERRCQDEIGDAVSCLDTSEREEAVVSGHWSG